MIINGGVYIWFVVRRREGLLWIPAKVGRGLSKMSRMVGPVGCLGTRL